MKSSRLNKLEAQLSIAETSLLGLLAQVLPRVARSGEMIFFNSDFLPDMIHSRSLPQESEPLLSLAKHAVSLRKELGLSVVGTVGQLYLSACSESENFANGNRRGPRQLATWMLGELESTLSFKADGAAAQFKR
jgi:hypothetical protein